MSSDDGRTPAVPREYVDTMLQHLHDNGFGDIVDITRAYLEIDTSAMRRAAEQVYGTAGTFRDEVISTNDPGYDAGQTQPAAELLAVTEDIQHEFRHEVEPNWEGPAYRAFADYNARLAGVTELESARLTVIGDELQKVAAAIDEAREAVEVTLADAAGVLLAGASLAEPSKLTVLLTAASTSLSWGNYLARKAEAEARLTEEQSLATVELHSPKVEGLKPSDLMPLFPHDVDDWQHRDPYD